MAYDDLTSGGFYPDPGDVAEAEQVEFSDLSSETKEFVLDCMVEQISDNDPTLWEDLEAEGFTSKMIDEYIDNYAKMMANQRDYWIVGDGLYDIEWEVK